MSVGEHGVKQDVCCKVLHVMKQGDISYRTKLSREGYRDMRKQTKRENKTRTGHI